jgi:hypothetical protein
VDSSSLALVAVPSPEELAYARLLIDIEVRRMRVSALDQERETLESALSRFAVAVKNRVGTLKDEIRQARLSIEEMRRRVSRLKADPDANPADVEREVHEELHGKTEEVPFGEEPPHFDEASGERPSARPPRRDSATEKELIRLYRELAKRYHPDLATDPVERDERDAIMLQINIAFRERDLAGLQKLMLEAESVRPAVAIRLHRQRLAWAIREVTRLDRQIVDLAAKLEMMRRSDTYTLWKTPDQSDKVLDDLEIRTQERLTREKTRLEEAAATYQRLAARRRRALLLRERIAAPPPPRTPLSARMTATQASD